MLSPDYMRPPPPAGGTSTGSNSSRGGHAEGLTPSSSSDRMTPDSDSDDDHIAVPGAETYELQERRGGGGGFSPGKYRVAGGQRYEDEDVTDGDDEYDGEPGGGYKPPRPRRRRAASVASFQLYTPDEEKAVVRKFDRKLVLFVALLYMLSFLDRSSMFSFSFLEPRSLDALLLCLPRPMHHFSSPYMFIL